MRQFVPSRMTGAFVLPPAATTAPMPAVNDAAFAVRHKIPHRLSRGIARRQTRDGGRSAANGGANDRGVGQAAAIDEIGDCAFKEIFRIDQDVRIGDNIQPGLLLDPRVAFPPRGLRAAPALKFQPSSEPDTLPIRPL